MLRTAAILAASLIITSIAMPAPAEAAKKGGGGGSFRAGGAPRVSGNVNRNVNRTVTVKKTVTINRNTNQNFRRVGGAGTSQKVLSKPLVSGPKVGGVSAAKFAVGPGQGKVFAKPANFQVVKLGNKVAPIWMGPKKIWWGGGWKTFVPFAALGAFAVGGYYYYPHAYLTVARPYCEGITPDGCRLNWQRVDFEDGGSDWQCVQFCRRPGNPPPPRTVALVAPPPMAQGGCAMSIYSEPGFSGTNATASDEQPDLSSLGWQNQIASVKVDAGTWDFFSDQQFTGETMRLQPGQYPDLGPQWTKRSGSFMCVQP